MKCSYCLSEVRKGTGIMFVSKIGNISYYCSSRCYKNGAVMRRKPRQVLGKHSKSKQQAK